MDWRQLAESVGLVVDLLGVAVIVGAIPVAVVAFVARSRDGEVFPDGYRALRTTLGRGILLGLELLIAGDIIRTVAVEPTLDSVAVLGLIVLVRTFLSLSLEVELEGRWPWRRGERPV